MSAISLQRQLTCATRELAMRHRVYQSLVSKGTMLETVAQDELATMAAIVETLQHLLQPVLFDQKG